MIMKRSTHSGVLLRDGNIAVVGGYSDTHKRTSSMEIYDVRANQWQLSAEKLQSPRGSHCSVLV
jgi:hypothetical protein